jgi:FtsH-binding integral membrane protein
MGALVREVFVTLACGVGLAGLVAAVVVPLVPPAWRHPLLVWGILLGAVVAVAWLRRRRQPGAASS